MFSRDHNESIVPSPDNAYKHTETIQYRLASRDLYINLLYISLHPSSYKLTPNMGMDQTDRTSTKNVSSSVTQSTRVTVQVKRFNVTRVEHVCQNN